MSLLKRLFGSGSGRTAVSPQLGLGRIEPATMDPVAKKVPTPPTTESTLRPRLLAAISADDAGAILELLRDEPGLLTNDQRKMQLVESAEESKAMNVLRLLAKNLPLTPREASALVSWPNVDSVRMLLQAGFDPNTRDENGRPAFYWAALAGSVDTVSLLLESVGPQALADRWPVTALTDLKHKLYWAQQKEQVYPAQKAEIDRLRRTVAILETWILKSAQFVETAPPVVAQTQLQAGVVSPAHVRYTYGWLVFYNQPSHSVGDVGEADFERVRTLVNLERSTRSRAGQKLTLIRFGGQVNYAV